MRCTWRGQLPEMVTMYTTSLKPFLPVAAALLIAGCAVGPTYQRPSAPDVSAYKEAGDWVTAAPADALERGPWWLLFNDPVLNDLAARVEVSNQNVAAAVAAYAQARALASQQNAALFPSVSLTGAANRSGNNAGSSTTDQLNLAGTWAPDVWGRLGRVADGAAASAAASGADLASAKLSAQGTLAVSYLSLRQQDAQLALLASTVSAYARALEITQNRYNAGVAAKTDVLQAQTQLANVKAQESGIKRQRAQFEHAVAVLVGQLPSSFAIVAKADWSPQVPDVPLGLPSALLQRRPDIAAAERRVAAANEQIGVAKSAYYPSLVLNASAGSASNRIGDLLKASTGIWALGVSAAQVVFDAGSITAKVDSAKAAHAQTVALYRQVVLTAFQGVEDQLFATAAYKEQEQLNRQSSQSADQVEQQLLNRYRSGQVGYTDVITAQTTALNARISLGQTQLSRQTTAVALIQALGGGWKD